MWKCEEFPGFREDRGEIAGTAAARTAWWGPEIKQPPLIRTSGNFPCPEWFRSGAAASLSSGPPATGEEACQAEARWPVHYHRPQLAGERSHGRQCLPDQLLPAAQMSVQILAPARRLATQGSRRLQSRHGRPNQASDSGATPSAYRKRGETTVRARVIRSEPG